MTFTSILEEKAKDTEETDATITESTKKNNTKGVTDIPSLIRGLGMKIKRDIPTNFGTEYILAKKYNKELTLLTQALDELIKKKLIKNYRLKGSSVFVEL